jgi:hypothetical protein
MGGQRMIRMMLSVHGKEGEWIAYRQCTVFGGFEEIAPQPQRQKGIMGV